MESISGELSRTIDKRTKEYRDSVKAEEDQDKVRLDYKPKAKVDFEKPANNPGWKLCMYCGTELAPNEDGTPKFRRFPEPCPDCIWRNA